MADTERIAKLEAQIKELQDRINKLEEANRPFDFDDRVTEALVRSYRGGWQLPWLIGR